MRTAIELNFNEKAFSLIYRKIGCMCDGALYANFSLTLRRAPLCFELEANALPPLSDELKSLELTGLFQILKLCQWFRMRPTEKFTLAFEAVAANCFCFARFARLARF